MTNQTPIKFMSKKSNNSLNHYKSGNSNIVGKSDNDSNINKIAIKNDKYDNLFLPILAENNKVISPIKINNKSYENKNIFM